MIPLPLVEKFAWLNTGSVKPPVTGIILRFSGLGSVGMKADPDPSDLEWGDVGGLTVTPYHDPWGWMNATVLDFVDDLVEAIRGKHGLGPEVPLIATGGSMGGHAALLYTMKSRHKIAACMALWPVCDIPFHYTERADLPRTFHHAYGNYANVDAALIAHSPLHQEQALPEIPYLIVHGEKDQSVGKAAHSDRLVAAMRQRGRAVEYLERPQLGHGNPMDFATSRRMAEFVMAQLRRRG